MAPAANRAEACTGIRLQAVDGATVYARTLEFAPDLDSQPIVVPRKYKFQGTTTSGKPGLNWDSKFGAVGMNGLGQMMIVDGVNEEGLASGFGERTAREIGEAVFAELEAEEAAAKQNRRAS